MDSRHPLVKDRFCRALLRFVKWQVLSRLSPGDHIVNWIGDVKFYVRSGETGLTQNIYVGLSEFKDMGFLLHLLREGDDFIDIGANSGSYTLLASSFSQAKCLSIEPVESTFRRLTANLELNRVGHLVHAVNLAVGSSKGFLRMTTNSNTTNRVILDKHEVEGILIETTTLDDLTLNINPIIIKIDVEGWELEVLKGAEMTLQKKSLVAIILEMNGSGNRYGASGDEILDMLHKLGFEPHEYDPISRELKKLEGQDLKYANTLFLKNLEFVRERIYFGPTLNIVGKHF